MSAPERSLGDRILASPTVQTLVIFVVVFVAMQFLAGIWPALAALFVLSTPITVQPWTLVTSVYSHASLGHLISNSIVLLLVGLPLERATTSWAFHLFFVATGAIAGLSQVWAVETMALVTAGLEFLLGWFIEVPTVDGNIGVLGASGAVFAMLGYHLTGNRVSSQLLGSFSIPWWAQVAAFAVLAVAVTLWTAAPGVALFAHFVGLLLGLVAGRMGLLPSTRATGDRDGSRTG
jgi:membrane associated rhomboid family serine protease